MGRECTAESCEVEQSSCESTSSECCKMCKTACGGDPLACAQAMWCSAFARAMHDVQVELLKERIKKAWGEKMGKAADKVVEGAGVHWGAMLAQAKTKEDFRDFLQRLWSEGK